MQDCINFGARPGGCYIFLVSRWRQKWFYLVRMSDEQTPPPTALRLKPRLRPAEGETPAATPAAPAPVLFIDPPKPEQPTAAAAPEAPKIRFKPRLATEAASPATTATGTPT